MRVRLVGLVALMALVLASCGVTSPETGGPSEGIQVHGDWTIDIYNEDGTLDRSVEFSNALTAEGANALLALLGEGARTSCGGGDPDCDTPTSTVDWFITLSSSDSSSRPCENAFGTPVSCTIRDVSVDTTSVAGHLVLSGSIEAERDGMIDRVSTLLPLVPGGNQIFTLKDVTDLDWNGDGTPNDGPIPVSAGQAVGVEVDVSFTSG